MVDLEEKMLEIFEKESNDMVEVYRLQIFHFGEW